MPYKDPSKRLENAQKRNGADETSPLIECACGCGQSLRQLDKKKRLRKYINGHNPWARSETPRGYV